MVKILSQTAVDLTLLEHLSSLLQKMYRAAGQSLDTLAEWMMIIVYRFQRGEVWQYFTPPHAAQRVMVPPPDRHGRRHPRYRIVCGTSN